MKTNLKKIIFSSVAIFTSLPSVSIAETLLAEPSIMMSHAEARSYLESIEVDPDEHFKHCCFHQNPEGGNRGVRFKPEDGWLVLVSINREALVRADLQGTCKTSFWQKDRECTDEEVAENLAEREMTYKAIPGWYGKFHNRFVAERAGTKIPDTQKFIGHRSSAFQRSEKADRLLIGPMPDKPDRLILRMSNSGTEYLLFEEVQGAE